MSDGAGANTCAQKHDDKLYTGSRKFSTFLMTTEENRGFFCQANASESATYFEHPMGCCVSDE